MPVHTAKELFVTVLSHLRHTTERSGKIYEELGQAAQNDEIKHAMDARKLISNQMTTRLDECFKLIGEQPVKATGRLHDIFVEDWKKELGEMQSPVARRLFVLAKANHLTNLNIGEYATLTAIADGLGQPAVGLLLESCLADKLAFVERNRRIIRELVSQKVAAAG